MAKNEKKVPLKEAMRLNLRAVKLLHQRCPGLFPSTVLHAVASAVSPYESIYFSARLIDELAGACRAEELVKWVLLTILSTVVLMLLTAVLERWENVEYDNPYYYRKNKIHGDKQASLDFADFDDQNVQDQYQQVIQNENWGGHGIPKMPYLCRRLIQSVAGIIGAVTLTVSLFTQRVPESAVQYAWMDHPVAVIALLAVLILIIVLSPVLQTKANSYDTVIADGARLGNRIFGAFGFSSKYSNCAMDLRIYRQQKLFRHYMSKSDTFTPGGVWARLAAGPQGLLYAASAALSVSSCSFSAKKIPANRRFTSLTVKPPSTCTPPALPL